MDPSPPTSLSRRTAVVTGGGRGIGRCISLALAAAGARVHVVARSAAEVQQSVQLIQARGGAATATAADLTDMRAVRDVLAPEVERACGSGVDIVVNAIGLIGPLVPVAEADPAEWTTALAANLLAPFLVCRTFVPNMLARGWGRVVNVSSAAALHPPAPSLSAYQTSKAALNQLTRCLASELEGTGVTANVVHPGEVKTAMWRDIAAQTARPGSRAKGLRGWTRWVAETGGDPPERVAGVVRWLCSDAASAINGRFVWIPGGLQPPVPVDWGLVAPEDALSLEQREASRDERITQERAP